MKRLHGFPHSPWRTRAVTLGVLIGLGLALCLATLPAKWSLGTLFAQTGYANDGGGVESIAPPKGTPEETADFDPIFEPDPLESLADSLRRKQRELDEREKQLAEDERRLTALKKEVELELTQIERALGEMKRIAGDADARHKAELKKWIQIYQKMKPDQAGRLIMGLDSDFQLELLSQMETAKAAKILNVYPSDKAIELGRKLDRRN